MSKVAAAPANPSNSLYRLACHAAGWATAAAFAFNRPLGYGVLAPLNALPAMIMLFAVVGFWRGLGGQAGTGTPAEPVHRDGEIPSNGRPGQPELRLLPAVLGMLFLLALLAVVVPGLSGLAVGGLQLLAAAGEQTAPRGAMPFEQLLVPAIDGLVRLCQWLIVPGVASSVAFEWHRWARGAGAEKA